MAKRYYDDGFYAGDQARRTQEMQDAGMLREDRSAVANMPQNVIYRPYPVQEKYMRDSELDDTIRGVDRQINELDGRKRDKYMNPTKG